MRGYLADPRFTAYYDDACSEGATEFLVKAVEAYQANRRCGQSSRRGIGELEPCQCLFLCGEPSELAGL
ncbi:TipAS antibiotic-recognition domain-containing protein [Parvibacter caecicola]|uniref:TipAS antibiotic-recognition domain-containing protein n=1 Tax=Parvibacter caecicola TaxID=747645 RepID=UPI001BE4B516